MFHEARIRMLTGAPVLVSLPHYMAGSVNELNAKAVDSVISGAATVFDYSLLAVEQVVMYAL